MDPEDFLFEQQGYGYDDEQYLVPAAPWWDVRARWTQMSRGHRTNAVLYALSAVSLALLMFEVTSGDDNPNLEVASQVVPASSTTSTSRPANVSTTSRVSSTTSSTVPKPTATTRAATTGTTRRPVAPAGQTAPQETEDPDPPAADPDPAPAPPAQQTTSPPAATTQPTTPQPTQPPATDPPATQPDITLGDRACELLAQVGRTHPSCP